MNLQEDHILQNILNEIDNVPNKTAFANKMRKTRILHLNIIIEAMAEKIIRMHEANKQLHQTIKELENKIQELNYVREIP